MKLGYLEVYPGIANIIVCENFGFLEYWKYKSLKIALKIYVGNIMALFGKQLST